MIPCTFGQRQGFITITREDGVTYELTPVGDALGNFGDQKGRAVYRESGLGRAGQISFKAPTNALTLTGLTLELRSSGDIRLEPPR